ncbi:D-2-hydroxyacid dehydrogenase [Staphylococcus kloosii]|jgi:D-lactate dehydrogenase|uniref:D-2-hydroxyacid dehydrogenase n=1 Tax=Staphylococcus kloosii TaxID=29384 RepID=UPI0018A11985|nr:D-2-hydroxyacid dehydrogenase [Staphylococcus kloosii]MBF7024924.1 D-2-hydroxyacid dehydrogenase [Staphylococcus kloosii]
MKLKLFDVGNDEAPFVEKWADENNVEVDYVPDSLTRNNINEVSGYDGLCLSHNGPFDNSLLKDLNDMGIKQIAQRSAGFDMYDLEAATANNIKITNVPSYSPNSIAEYALTGALYFVRKVPTVQRHVAKQDFRWQPTIMARPIKGLTVAVIGTGRIGYIAAELFHHMGCNVIGYDIQINPQAEKFITYKDTVQEAVKDADIVTLHTPATKETIKMFNRELFSHFKDGAIFINCARGVLVDTEALIHALDTNKLSGAVIDTYENEATYFRKDFSSKEIEDDLLTSLMERDDILLSPHIAFYTNESVENLVERSLNSTMEILRHGDSEFVVNK